MLNVHGDCTHKNEFSQSDRLSGIETTRGSALRMSYPNLYIVCQPHLKYF